ncbi:MAG: tannase/feruloyl esterase family alpha/beta hydrolase [Acidobacteriota bacterium]|nr:tannase/feruloyl esterase family alpha/beta hydrolase [Acidobacteriota bacterium]
MNRKTSSLILLCALCSSSNISYGAMQDPDAQSQSQSACEALTWIPDLTITLARIMESTDSTPRYCYVKGIISPAISYHVQLPLPKDWNGRFVNWGDGGKDGDLDFADHRVSQGYAVANSNTGHDNGSEPGASFGFNNRQAEIDFGYRAVHLTVNAAKTLIEAYYDRPPRYSYHEGCSTGGRQGLMEAQRYPYDFDGIIAGAPVHYYQELNTTHVFNLQRVFQNNLAGNLAYDVNGDGTPESLTKVKLLHNKVLDKCDANDGIVDGVIDDPLNCDFDPDVDLATAMCTGDINNDECLTKAQVQTIKDFYRGSYTSTGESVFKGKPLGSEFSWSTSVVPHKGNSMTPARMNTSGDHVNYLFYENDPGIAPPDLSDPAYSPDKDQVIPEWAWWEFNIDEIAAGAGDFMKNITNATETDMSRFLLENDGRLLLYHGWGDADSHPEPTLDYYNEVVQDTFEGDLNRAKSYTRLFMVPGMAHCGGGPGPNDWDKLAPLIDWVENGKPPNHIIVTHKTGGVVDNERRVCAYPQQATYVGPSEGKNNRANWVEKNFACR